MSTTQQAEPGRQLLDYLVFGPIGLAFEARRLLPELAGRGRRQIDLSRTVGRVAVQGALRRIGVPVEGALDAVGQRRTAAPRVQPGTDPPPDIAAPPGPRLRADHLAIPEYESLAASQVVSRLRGLTPDEVSAVRDYELATRGRRTILTAIARLED